MSEHMTSPTEKHPPKGWWLENACRVAAVRLRNQKYIGANVWTIREQIADSIEFVRIVWEEIEKRSDKEDDSA